MQQSLIAGRMEVEAMSNKRRIIVFGIAVFLTGLGFKDTAIGQGKPAVSVELNKATSEQLSKCPGLTPALAKAIVDYRSKSGPFKKPEELMKVKGITKEILNKLNPKVEKEIIYIMVPTSASEEDEEEPSLKPSKC